MNTKRIGTLLLALSLAVGSANAATHHPKPDATLQITSGSVAAGIGWSWGSGTLTYKGKAYPVKVKGLSIGKVGITNASASGRLFNMHKLEDFNGTYTAAGAGATIAGGVSKVTMKNQNGVTCEVTATSRGLDLTLGGGGVEMKIKK